MRCPEDLQDLDIGGRDEGSKSMYLSVIIPAYNEEKRIGNTLLMIHTYLQQQPYTAEILVVDDGSQDGTSSIVGAFDVGPPTIQLLHNERNRGKGYSVRRGFLYAKGDYLLFSDADLSTPIAEMEKLFAALDEPCDIAIGSRALPGARVEVHQPRYREYLGRLFNMVVRLFAVPGIFDTQCGFKCFKRQAALAICERMTTERFGFDVEMLYLACQLGYRVREVPVIWRHSPQTRVRMRQDAISMLGDLFRIRLNDYRGRYNRPPQQSTPDPHWASGASIPEERSVAKAVDHFGNHSSEQP